MDPVIFSFNIGDVEFAIRWYGVLVGLGVVLSSLIVERGIDRRGGDKEFIWDLLIWIIPAGIVGARLGYVLNDIGGGGTYFVENPEKIFAITEGGLHIYGAFALGLLAAYIFAKRRNFDFWLLLDALAPALLIGQAIGRPANFINQELYGQPTELSWGIPISPENRIAPFNDLAIYPEATTRFHPTFAYEIIWNVLAALLIIWLFRKFAEQFKPGSAFYSWMILEGVGRFIIEYFRPDQPRIPGTDFSISRLIAVLLVLIGGFLMLVRYEKIKLVYLSPGPEKYALKTKKWKK